MLNRARYIVRLDDACPTMNRQKWARIEAVLDAHEIKPVVAVVPDNRDPDLIAGEADPQFWDRAREWQTKKWSIAMHGLCHALRETGATQILPFHRRSEFSGLSYEEQAERILKSKHIFDTQKIRMDAWIAPAHGFDLTTLRALKDVTDARNRIISDGLAAFPYYEHGFLWVPQQLWRFRRMPFGIWTVCFHPNAMSEQALDVFERDVSHYAERIMNFRDVRWTWRRRSPLDRVINAAYWLRRGQYLTALR